MLIYAGYEIKAMNKYLFILTGDWLLIIGYIRPIAVDGFALY